MPTEKRKDFSSARELVEFLDGRPSEGYSIVYRGEAKEHAIIKPSLSRFSHQEQIWHEFLMRGLSLHLLEDLMRPHLEWDEYGPRYKGKWIGGDLRYAEQYLAEPQNLWPTYQVEAILQHYGWRTHSLDVTVSPTVAVFFAGLDFWNERVLTEGEGYVYCWRREEMFNFAAPIVDLYPIAEVLSGMFEVESTRPHAQEGAILRLPGAPRDDESFAYLKESAEVFVFDRHDIEEVINTFDFYFPPDGLSEKLTSFESLYLKYCIDNAQEFSDKGYIAFLEAKLKSNEASGQP